MLVKQNKKKLADIFSKKFILENNLGSDISVDAITDDSRDVQANTIFLARTGEVVDGSKYIESAISDGACLVLTETIYQNSNILNVPIIYLPDLKQNLAVIFTNFYDVDLSSLNLFGVTGTNGKTSVAHILAQVLDCGYIGTIGIGKLDNLKPTQNTTPNIQVLINFFAKLQNQNINNCALEISSHALTQQRTIGLPIKTAVFTNLSHDHLDYHDSMHDYAESKYKLFLETPIQNAVIAIDDLWGRELVSKLSTNINCYTYGLNNKADLHPVSLQETINGINAVIQTPVGKLALKLNLIGQFNVLNIMAVIGILLFERWSLTKIITSLENVNGISGRMEVITKQPTFVVDYAHTPDALEKALQALKPLSKAKLWCIFGCGGDRDQAKRPLMAQAAEKYADQIILTNDNPRSENPSDIIDDIKHGLVKECVHVIIDRKEAIEYCFKHSQIDDVILIAGKGHEDYQIINNQTYSFSDQQTIKNLFLNS